MPDRSFARSICLAVAGLRAMHDVVAGASGIRAYEQYLAHMRAHHPEAATMSREAFFRADLTARWDGIRRCC